jgi:hypothetical protein
MDRLTLVGLDAAAKAGYAKLFLTVTKLRVIEISGSQRS